MEENEVIVEESVNNLEVAEQEETVENTVVEVEENAVETEESEGKVEERQEEEQAEVETTIKKEQTKEEQRIARLARLDAEKKMEQKIEKARQEALEQGKKLGQIQSVIGKTNPYTGETIKDDYDAQEYMDMFELDSNGKDPIKDYRILQKERAQKEAENQIKQTAEQKKAEWYQNDTKDFVDKYSVEELKKLSSDKDFNMFAEGKLGNIPLATIYENYKSFIGKYEKKSVQTAKQIVANSNTTPGRLSDGEAKVLDWNTMSREKFNEYLKKAKDGEL